MAIHRGIQSAIFFYLSCAPCAEAQNRKKRRREAVWERAERDALAEEMPDVYRHPEPSSTNIHWQGEIALGPTLQSRGGTGKKRKNGGRKPSGDMLSSNASVAGASSLDLHAMQREDEELWGEGGIDGPVQRPPRAMRKRGRSNETSATAGTTSTSAAYSIYRSPPVSDQLPPIVRTVHAVDEVAWMMQPPPVADVMSGKSGPRSATSSRQASTRMARTVSKASSRATSSVMLSAGDSPRITPLDRIPTSRVGGGNENVETSLPVVRRVASRPPLLSTIASEGNVPTEADLSLVDSAKSHTTSLKRPDTPPPRPKHHTRSNSDSKNVSVLKGRIFTATENSSPTSPPDVMYTAEGEVREELFDSWYTPDFELGRWVHENTRREGIRERWSFDV